MLPAGASQYHGDKGAMKVESPRYYNELHGAFFEAAAAAGLKPNPDFNEWNRPQVSVNFIVYECSFHTVRVQQQRVLC
jgi:choline dehydrogenase-like flavoprotein